MLLNKILTPNRRKFAALVAQGVTQVEAYEQAYGKKKNGSYRTVVQKASDLARVPEVRAAIEKFESEVVMLPIVDLRECRQRMLANIQWLAQNSHDHRVRLAASIDLRNYADVQEEREKARARQPLTIDALITEIRQLEAPEPAMEMEAVEEAEPEPAESRAAMDGSAE